LSAGFFNSLLKKIKKSLAITKLKHYNSFLKESLLPMNRGKFLKEKMEGYFIQLTGEITFLGEISLSEELLKEAKNAFDGDHDGALKNQLEALFMSHFLENVPDSWGPRCGAIIRRNVWVGGPRIAELWLKALPHLSPISDADKNASKFSFSDFPDFWFCCTKEDTPEGFNNLLTKKTFFSDLVGHEKVFLQFFKSVYWTRLCPLEHPKKLLHLAKTSLYSLKTVKARLGEAGFEKKEG
jgi:hypothetical protein